MISATVTEYVLTAFIALLLIGSEYWWHWLDSLKQWILSKFTRLFLNHKQKAEKKIQRPVDLSSRSSNLSSYSENADRISFDYSTNNGVVSVGSGDAAFDLHFSKASDSSIYFYTGSNITKIARVKDIPKGSTIRFEDFDSSSRHYTLNVGEIGLARNGLDHTIEIKIISILCEGRNSTRDEVTFAYKIMPEDQSEFAAL